MSAQECFRFYPENPCLEDLSGWTYLFSRYVRIQDCVNQAWSLSTVLECQLISRTHFFPRAPKLVRDNLQTQWKRLGLRDSQIKERKRVWKMGKVHVWNSAGNLPSWSPSLWVEFMNVPAAQFPGYYSFVYNFILWNKWLQRDAILTARSP